MIDCGCCSTCLLLAHPPIIRIPATPPPRRTQRASQSVPELLRCTHSTIHAHACTHACGPVRAQVEAAQRRAAEEREAREAEFRAEMEARSSALYGRKPQL